MAAMISVALAVMRQGNVLFGDAVGSAAQAYVLFARTTQEGKLQQASESEVVEADPDLTICEGCHHEVRPFIYMREIITCGSSGER